MNVCASGGGRGGGRGYGIILSDCAGIFPSLFSFDNLCTSFFTLVGGGMATLCFVLGQTDRQASATLSHVITSAAHMKGAALLEVMITLTPLSRPSD